MPYERGVLERVVAGRTQALTATTPAQKGGTEAWSAATTAWRFTSAVERQLRGRPLFDRIDAAGEPR